MFDFGELSKVDPAWLEFRWGSVTVEERLSNQHYAANDIVRAFRDPGFYLQCSVAGRTGRSEPIFRPVENGTFVDGEVTWTVKRSTGLVLVTVASCVYTITPSGIVQDDAEVDAAKAMTRVRLDASAAALGPYEIIADMVTSSGEDYAAKGTFTVVD